MVPRVEQFGPELDESCFREKRDTLTHGDVPVVDSGATQYVYPGVAKIELRRARESIAVEIPVKSTLGFVQVRIAYHCNTGAFGRAGDVRAVRRTDARRKGRTADEGRDSAQLPIVQHPRGELEAGLGPDSGQVVHVVEHQRIRAVEREQPVVPLP